MTSRIKMAEERRPQRLEMISTPGTDDDTHRTFVLHNEGHTLGNALRYIIMKNPDVELCGYNQPHPSEDKINFRIHTRGPPATEVFDRGLKQLATATQHIQNVFEASIQNFKQSERCTDDVMDTA